MTASKHRAPRWDQATRERFLSALRLGESIRRSCKLAGCSSETVYAWLARGEDEDEGEHRAFVDAVAEARVAARLRLTKLVARAARKDWRAALAYLRILDPERWGGRDLKLEALRRRKALAEAMGAEAAVIQAREAALAQARMAATLAARPGVCAAPLSRRHAEAEPAKDDLHQRVESAPAKDDLYRHAEAEPDEDDFDEFDEQLKIARMTDAERSAVVRRSIVMSVMYEAGQRLMALGHDLKSPEVQILFKIGHEG